MLDTASPPYDTLIRNALVFDGSGGAPRVEDVAIRDGKIAERGTGLSLERAAAVVDGSGKWLMPGLLDIHTHLDLEVEVNPGLGEAVRHGTTSVVVGNCSLGTAFGAQQRNGENPVIDCFTRVENMPKRVLQKCVDRMTWDNTGDYLEHFEHIPLGPNIAPLVPHSMLRAEVMGIEGSISRQPTSSERRRMRQLLMDAIEQGYIGMSTDAIIFHYLSNDPHKDKRIPTQFTSEAELREMIEILRDADRVWQATPDGEKMGTTLRRFFWTSGRLHGKPLRVTALTALDFKSTPGMWKSMLRLSKFLNSPLIRGNFHFQALSTNFRMWANGIQVPIFEELPSTRALIACEVEDRDARMRLLDDPEWQAQFRRDWRRVEPRTGIWKHLPGGGKATFQMDAADIIIDEGCPMECWHGQDLASIFARFRAWRAEEAQALDEQEADFFERAGADCDSLPDFFIHCLREFDLKFRWWMDVANLDREITKQILFDPYTLPGFNDSGAHITNLAFYDGNLVTLQLAQDDGPERVAQAVKRLTSEPADFFGIDVGRLEVGKQADLVLIDPERLRRYDSNANRQIVYNPFYEHDVLVNRSDGVVDQVYIRGERVWEEGGRYTVALGSKTLGRALTCCR